MSVPDALLVALAIVRLYEEENDLRGEDELLTEYGRRLVGDEPGRIVDDLRRKARG